MREGGQRTSKIRCCSRVCRSNSAKAISKMKTQPVRVRADTHEAVVALQAEIAQKGWRTFGVAREDYPTISAVIDEACKRLAAARQTHR
jgi:hypothetical protein